MAADPKPHVTPEQYYALAQAEGPTFEWWDGELVMLAGKFNHSLIANNVTSALRDALKGKDCQVFGEGLAVDTPSLTTYRIPDGVVICGKARYVDYDGVDAVTNPLVIVEVTSRATQRLDHGPKLEAYKQIESMREYLIVEQFERKVTRWCLATTGQWIGSVYADGVVPVTSLPVDLLELSLDRVYSGVEFRLQGTHRIQEGE